MQQPNEHLGKALDYYRDPMSGDNFGKLLTAVSAEITQLITDGRIHNFRFSIDKPIGGIMKIETLLLINSMKKIIDYIEDMGINEVEVSDNYYLNIESTERFNLFDENNKNLNKEIVDVGSLIDDVIELKKDIDEEGVVSNNTIDRLASVLEYFSYYIDKNIFNKR